MSFPRHRLTMQNRYPMFRFIFIMTLSAVLAACAVTPRNPAPIVERKGALPASSLKSADTPTAAKPGNLKTNREPEGRAYYTVQRGDTLIHIALEFGQNYRDLISWNNLANPNDIKVDQVLRVSPPEKTAWVTVAPGVQTAPVAASLTAQVRPLNANNANGASPAGVDAQRNTTSAAQNKVEAAPSSAAPRPPAKPELATNEEDDAVAWTWPTQGKLSGNFDDAKKGIDIAGVAGQDVIAAAAGKILYANSIRGYGNLVIVKHSNNILSAYAHNKTILVKENQMVTKGQKIAEMGNTDSEVIKLHFEIRQQGKPVDPLKFLPSR